MALPSYDDLVTLLDDGIAPNAVIDDLKTRLADPEQVKQASRPGGGRLMYAFAFYVPGHADKESVNQFKEELEGTGLVLIRCENRYGLIPAPMEINIDRPEEGTGNLTTKWTIFVLTKA